ncbi:MAG: zinc-binding dehydrogenase [Firmicutes bacterium]|nr:zinc-binding dehydrogenase [Bacillota bacterium]
MRTAVLEGPHKFVIRDIPKPIPKADEVLIKVAACGVCHSEMPSWEGKFNNFPSRIGHEVSGFIEEVGSQVESLKVGQPVTVFTDKEGYSEYIAVKAPYVIPLGPDVLVPYALGEPVGCVVNGVLRAGIQMHDTVVLVGTGFMGQIMLQMVLRSAKQVIAVDTRDSALKMARQLGVEHCINPIGEDAVEIVKELTGGQGADCVIELTGNQQGLDLATKLTRIRGRLVIFGFHVGQRNIDMFTWNWRGLDVVNAHERDPMVYTSGIRIGMDLMQHGLISLNSLITHEYSLEEINEAFATASDRKDNFIKAVIRP